LDAGEAFVDDGCNARAVSAYGRVLLEDGRCVGSAGRQGVSYDIGTGKLRMQDEVVDDAEAAAGEESAPDNEAAAGDKGAEVVAEEGSAPDEASAAEEEGSAAEQEGLPRGALETLLHYKADPNAKGVDGRSPLHEAVRGQQNAAVTMLLAHGADPEAKDQDGWTALQWAEDYGYEDTATAIKGQSPMKLITAAPGSEQIVIQNFNDACKFENVKFMDQVRLIRSTMTAVNCTFPAGAVLQDSSSLTLINCDLGETGQFNVQGHDSVLTIHKCTGFNPDSIKMERFGRTIVEGKYIHSNHGTRPISIPDRYKVL